MRQFGARTIEKEYLALVRGDAPAPRGRIEAPVGRDPRDRQRMAVVADGREAVTEYEVLGGGGGYTLLALHPLTGRTHQIRAHLAYLRLPIAGDLRYGGGIGPRRPAPTVPARRAAALDRPMDGRRMSAWSELPADLAASLAVIGIAERPACRAGVGAAVGSEADGCAMGRAPMTSSREPTDEPASKRMTFPNPMLVVVSRAVGRGKEHDRRGAGATAPPGRADRDVTTTPRRRTGRWTRSHYHFLTLDEFEALRERGGLLESAEVHGNWYGTPVEQVRGILAAGRDAILTIDPQGARSVRGRVPDALLIFVMPPSMEDLR